MWPSRLRTVAPCRRRATVAGTGPAPSTQTDTAIPRLYPPPGMLRHTNSGPSGALADLMTHTTLVVDDDPAQRRLMQAMAERAGFQTMTAASGKEALDILQGPKG